MFLSHKIPALACQAIGVLYSKKELRNTKIWGKALVSITLILAILLSFGCAGPPGSSRPPGPRGFQGPAGTGVAPAVGAASAELNALLSPREEHQVERPLLFKYQPV